jgi:hypothetical protein
MGYSESLKGGPISAGATKAILTTKTQHGLAASSQLSAASFWMRAVNIGLISMVFAGSVS